MNRHVRKDLLDHLFEVGIALKGLDGLFEVAGGVLLLLVSPSGLNRLVVGLTRHELSQDPGDFIARHVLRSVHGLTGSSLTFAAAYLLSHGLVKIVLVVALLRNRLWAYPWMIAFLVLFIVYQLYRLAVLPTISMAGLSMFDGLIAWLTFLEYRKQRVLHGYAGQHP